jgi:hypothetical protein
MNVAAIGFQIENRVSHNLARPVIRDITAASRLVHSDAEFSQACVSGHNVGAAAVAFDTECDDSWMLQEQQQIRDVSRAALLDEAPLHDKRFVVGNNTKAADFKLAHHVSLNPPFLCCSV